MDLLQFCLNVCRSGAAERRAMENLANIKYILNKFDRFITSYTRKETDEDITLYEHWIDCKHDVEEKIKQISDLEDNGLLLRLPCKIGDTIYEVSYENREFVIKEHIVKEFIYRTYRFPRIEIYCENENGFLVCNNIGKLDEFLFLTQAEAEQKLKEMENR